MKIARRKFVKCLTAAAAAVASGLPGPQGARIMYGLIAKLTAVPGKRDELIRMLGEGTKNMPGCLSYILAKDSVDENAVWVTEIWGSAASHDASLTLTTVKDTIARTKPLVAGFEKVAVTNPVGGIGFPLASNAVPKS
jgi:quinol monooxygenase YgiN